ncbi:5-formyltetrahydrofolate cyclo-ligase [Halorubellus sp. JP-L1]|uniref:5-formyltetrahydrofolate cyclo-ligase n=1 Tax=Halorubellus sp. JP-L1 TaxID=2715753 RepID=UPI00140B15D4|nr:5-formyltetrahydrofolate cyclo-ligase [Halorubellus sp. JP-L1]NHN43099.1 5-formyltetrahydrofolate cyclo-ligase [Halorubellus sp. JP-L1]
MDKQSLREAVWDELEESGEARFPFPPHGRIPNVAGAADAADRLAATDAWRDADVLKANPDAPQLPVRRRALHEGKTVYMAVPRLATEEPFYELDPERLDASDYDAAATVSKVESYAEPVAVEDVAPVDLVVSGSVAVSERGARVGKGEGYSDLEWAVLAMADLVDGDTTVATTVHERQVRDVPEPDAHDVPMDAVCTPERTIWTDTPYDRPAGIDAELLSDDRVEEIPVLQDRT